MWIILFSLLISNFKYYIGFKSCFTPPSLCHVLYYRLIFPSIKEVNVKEEGQSIKQKKVQEKTKGVEIAFGLQIR